MAWTSLCDVSELIEGQGKYVEVSGFQLAVFLDKGNMYVMDNTCPHAGGNMSSGFVDDGCAVCPWHYWTFKLDNGEMPGLPGVFITTYKTRTHAEEGKAPVLQADLPIY